MKISRIKIENFRSIKSTEFVTSDFNIFVGQNNCGKTNFFEAIEFFYNGGKGYNINDLKYNYYDINLQLIEQTELAPLPPQYCEQCKIKEHGTNP